MCCGTCENLTLIDANGLLLQLDSYKCKFALCLYAYAYIITLCLYNHIAFAALS